MSELRVTTLQHEAAAFSNITLNASGNVGIGVSSPAVKLDVSGSVGGSGSGFNPGTTAWVSAAFKGTGSYGGGISFVDGSNGAVIYAGAQNLIFGNGVTSGGTIERMRIDSSGNLLVGTTSKVGAEKVGVSFDRSSQWGMVINNTSATSPSNATMIDFRYVGSQVGYIGSNGTSTSYNTSSDYRLKEDWVAVADASTRVNALKPVNFAWKVNGERVDGFLAHELAEVVPEAVTGTKDAMRDEEYEVTPAVLDDEGAIVTPAVMGTRSVPDYQGIDQSKLVPLLTAALQEALAAIETLTARVSALETK